MGPGAGQGAAAEARHAGDPFDARRQLLHRALRSGRDIRTRPPMIGRNVAILRSGSIATLSSDQEGGRDERDDDGRDPKRGDRQFAVNKTAL